MDARRVVALEDTPRRATLVGDLVRAEDGTLVLELPHVEMGAQCFVLQGRAGARLDGLLPRGLAFSTPGDLSA